MKGSSSSQEQEQECYCSCCIRKLHILKTANVCADCTNCVLILITKSATGSSKEESGARSGGGGNKAMDCSRHRVLACIACAGDHCNAINTLCRNHAQQANGGPGYCTLYTCKRHTFYQKPIRPIKQCTVRLKSKGYKFRPSYAIPITDFLPLLRICGSDEMLFVVKGRVSVSIWRNMTLPVL